jgi:hypothetical protein
MGTPPLSPKDIRAAAGAHHELGPEYSDAVVASFLEKVDQEIAARIDERLATSTPRPSPAEREHRRTLAKGFAMGVASSVAVVLLVVGIRPEHHAFLWLLALMVVCGSGVRWASRHWTIRRTVPRQGPRAVGGDSSRLI